MSKDKKKELLLLNKNLKNIKSDYFIKIIFNNLEVKKLLEITKYNKRIQKILNININEYKEYHEQIEIEIIPEKNKYGKFINIINKEDELY